MTSYDLQNRQSIKKTASDCASSGCIIIAHWLLNIYYESNIKAGCIIPHSKYHAYLMHMGTAFLDENLNYYFSRLAIGKGHGVDDCESVSQRAVNCVLIVRHSEKRLAIEGRSAADGILYFVLTSFIRLRGGEFKFRMVEFGVSGISENECAITTLKRLTSGVPNRGDLK